MASVDFLLQGLNATEDHYAAVEQLLRLPNISYCLIGTAFMNSAGAAMVVDKLSAIAPNLQLIVGVRNGVTSKQSIEILKAHNIIQYVWIQQHKHLFFIPRCIWHIIRQMQL